MDKVVDFTKKNDPIKRSCLFSKVQLQRNPGILANIKLYSQGIVAKYKPGLLVHRMHRNVDIRHNKYTTLLMGYFSHSQPFQPWTPLGK